MADREKVIKGLEHCRKTSCESCPYNATDIKNSNPICLIDEMLSDALAMLKEQQHKIWELNEINEYLDDVKKDQEHQIDVLKEQFDKDIIVRCKDCKHRPKEIPFTTTWGGHDTYFEFPEGSGCPCQCSDDPYYSWNPDDDWFCADGERKEGR